MRGPPKRNGPASAANTQPGHDRSLVKVRDQETCYSEAAEISTAACADCALLHPYENGGGECRALPPRIVEDSFMREGQWPRVSPWDWCGAFVRRAGA